MSKIALFMTVVLTIALGTSCAFGASKKKVPKKVPTATVNKIAEVMIANGGIRQECIDQASGDPQKMIEVEYANHLRASKGPNIYMVSGTNNFCCGGARRCNQTLFMDSSNGPRQILEIVQPDEISPIKNNRAIANGLKYIQVQYPEGYNNIYYFDGFQYVGYRAK
jgi:hypothetical protein